MGILYWSCIFFIFKFQVKQLNYVLEHNLEILEIDLNQTENVSDRKIVFIDINRDMYISPVHKKDMVFF